MSSRKTRYGKTKEVKIWRPRERTGEAEIQRPREKADSKRPKYMMLADPLTEKRPTLVL